MRHEGWRRVWHVVALSLASIAFDLAGSTPAPATLPSGRQGVRAGAESQLVSFSCGEALLHGWLYKPDGKGPFPAVVYNHGSEKNPGWFPPLGKFWIDRGFVFFVPHRRGHGQSSGEYIGDLQRQFRSQARNVEGAWKNDVELNERANLDVVAAVEWLKSQPFVDTNKLVVSGVSYGGIQTLLMAEKGLGVKACVAFAPGAMSWAGNGYLRERLRQAVMKAEVPIFLIQAKNDYNLGPSEMLGAELQKKGAPNRSKVYPVFGNPVDPQDGHYAFAVNGSDVWGEDVMSFIHDVLNK